MFSKDTLMKLTRQMETRLNPCIKKISNKVLDTNPWMVKLIEFYQEEMGDDSDESSRSSRSGSSSSGSSSASSESVKPVKKKASRKPAPVLSSSGSNSSRSQSEQKSSKLSNVLLNETKESRKNV